MKKTALGIAVAVVGVAVAGAWYTGTRVEQVITDNINQANLQLEEELPELGAYLTLIELKRGVFSSEARYSLTFTGDDPTEPQVLLFNDQLEHGPFPLSRLVRGRLMPVMAQSHFSLEQNELSAPLFKAAGGKTPVFGQVSVHYNQSADGRIESAALRWVDDEVSFKLSPSQLDFSVSQDASSARGEWTLASAEMEANDALGQGKAQLRDFALSFNKHESANGFAIGPSEATLKSLSIQAPGQPDLVMRDALIGEELKVGSKGLDQSLSYQVGKVDFGAQEVGGFKLHLSLKHLDEQVLNRFKNTLAKLQDEGDDEQLSAAEEQELEKLMLGLLANEPVFSIDELLLTSQNGTAKASVTVELRQPADLDAPTEDLVRSSLAAVNADVKVDKALIGDAAVLRLLAENGPDVDPELLKMQAEMMTALFSGMALGSQWAVEDGEALKSVFSYGKDSVTLNGKSMTLPEFFAFIGQSGAGDVTELEIEVEEE